MSASFLNSKKLNRTKKERDNRQDFPRSHMHRCSWPCQSRGPGLALTTSLCAEMGRPGRVPRDACPGGGCFREAPAVTPAPRPPSKPQPSLPFLLVSQYQPPGLDGIPCTGLLWRPPLLSPLSPQTDALLENSPLPGEGLRVQEGQRDPVRPPFLCLLGRGLALPLFLWSRQAWLPQSSRGCCRRSAHRNPSPRA